MTLTPDRQIGSQHRGRSDHASEARISNLSAPLRVGSSQDDPFMQQVAGVGTALLSACLVPAAAMALLWSPANIGGSAFVLTFGMTFGHAILLGLPLFLILRSQGWVNVTTCEIAGFAVGAGPAAALSWPTQHPQSHAVGSDTAVLISGWVNFLTPPAHFGMFGVLGGVAFWLVLSSFDASEKSEVQVRFLQSRRPRA